VNSKLEAAPGDRDLRFDTLRGLFLVCMTINHLPTEMRRLTDQSLGIFSAAEGFVFLSGLLAGWVYTRRFRSVGRRGLWHATSSRAGSIYRWHVGAFLACFVIAQATEHILGFCSPTTPLLFFQRPALSVGLGTVLLYQPGLLDLLPMYCAFVILLPVVIGALEAGRRWTVLGISAAIWLAVQWAPPVDGAPLYPLNTGSFNLLAWQMLFFAGVAVGHARISGFAQVRRPSPWAVAGALAVAVYAFGYRHGMWAPVWPDHELGMLLNKPALGLLRLADFGSVAYLVAIVGDRFPALLTSKTLAVLGRHSLAVVAVQSVLVTSLLEFPGLFDTGLSRTLTASAAIMVLFATAAYRDRQRRSTLDGASAILLEARKGAGSGLLRPHDARAA
jgi:hypothetical protein